MTAEAFNNNFVDQYVENGEKKFYRFLLTYALNKLILIQKGNYRGISPDLEFLEYYDRLMILYRRQGDDKYLITAKLLRKAAHKIYRIMLKKKMTSRNPKFLNLV